jgi:hypothetical protein
MNFCCQTLSSNGSLANHGNRGVYGRLFHSKVLSLLETILLGITLLQLIELNDLIYLHVNYLTLHIQGRVSSLWLRGFIPI